MVLGTRTLKPGTLISILGEIYTNQETGTLVFQQEKTNKFLYAEEGRFIFAASSATEDRFTRILVDKGKLSEDQLKIAQEKRDGKTIGRTLVEMGFLTSGDLLEALVDQMHRVAAGVANWKSGQAIFKADVLPKNVAKLPISTPRLILDTALAVEDREWAARELDKLEAPITMSAAEREAAMGLPLAPHEIRLIETIDGKKNARQICDACNVEVFDGARLLIGINRLGLCHVRQTFAPAERSSKKTVEEDKTPPLVEEEPKPLSFELAEPAPEEAARAPEVPSEQQGRSETPPAAEKGELPFSEEPAGHKEETPATPVKAGDKGKAMPEWKPKAPPPSREDEEKLPPETRKSGTSWLLIGSVVTVVLAVAIVAAWYFYMRKPSPHVANRKTPPASMVVPPKQPKAGVPSATAEANETTPEKAPTGNTTQKTMPGKTPTHAAVKASPPKHLAPEATKPAPSEPSSSNVREAQRLLSEGRFSEAAGVFQKVYRSISGKYTINVEVACQEETVKKAFEASNGDPAFLVLHYKLGSRNCYRILWGVYRDRISAEKALKDMPEFLLRDANPKVAHRRK